MIDAELRKRMNEASVEDLSCLLLETARLIAERRGKGLGMVHSLGGASAVAVLLGVGPHAVMIHRCNGQLAEWLGLGASGAGVIAQRKMAGLPFPTGGGGQWREGR